jgi:mono/diheme cytochrome c family protein
MLLALTTGHKLGLALMGALFIAFSLISSFVLPKRNPNFPGRHRNLYLVVAAGFFFAMMSAVIVFGRENAAVAEAVNGTSPTTPTSTSPTSTQPTTTGNAAAGKATFASAGCSACHEFKAAGSNGTVGPSLDNIQSSATKAGQPLDQYIKTSIEDPNKFIAPGYHPGVMPKLPLTPTQVDDLAAFISSNQQ